jgi:hypothetical protein
MEGSGRGLIWGTMMTLAWRNSGKSRKPSVRIAGVRTEIWTRDLPNTKQSANRSAATLGRAACPEVHFVLKRSPLYLHPTALPGFHRLPVGGPRTWWGPVAVVVASSPATVCAPDYWNSACTASPVPGQNVSPVRQASSSLHTRDNRTGPTGTSSSLENIKARSSQGLVPVFWRGSRPAEFVYLIKHHAARRRYM